MCSSLLHLSFHQFPSGSKSEKVELRKKWISLISRKDFTPTEGHRVCSEHFPGGKKTYLNNLPLNVPKKTRPAIPKPRTTFRARNRDVLVVLNPNENVDMSTQNGFYDDENEGEAINQTPEDEVIALQDELHALQKRHMLEVEALQSKLSLLTVEKETLLKASFHVDIIKKNDEKFHFYTGLPDYETFKILHDSFGKLTEKLIYHDSNTNVGRMSEESQKRGPKRSLSSEQELFLVLARLRCGLLEVDIAHRAGISCSHLSRIFITWVDFLHSRLRALPIWPTKETIVETMPKCFKETYPSTRVIIDATEIFIEMPSSFRTQSESYSNYKHHNTAKGLVGIAPCGSVTFVSDLYAGRCSDKVITKDCGIYDLLEPGDSVMADKGFAISDDLPPSTHLNIPPFLREKASFTIEEETETRHIASVRVHVERAIRRIKTFRILKTMFPISMAADLNKIWVVCAYLTNLLPPLITEETTL